MGWRDRLRTVLAAEATALFSEECADANSANSANRSGGGAGAGAIGTIGAIGKGAFSQKDADVLPPPPADAPALLTHLRDVLHCRVWLDGATVRIGPTHRCPPAVLAAALAVVGELRGILEAEGADFLPAVLGA